MTQHRECLVIHLMHEAYDTPEELFDFCYIPSFEQRLDELALLAEPENWDYSSTGTSTHPILKNYLKYTWKRIAEEKKVAITADEQHACWNTGLISPRHEEIFILFTKNHTPSARQYWHFNKFSTKGKNDLNRFPSLPDMAHYFDDPSLLVYDCRMELRVNYEHVIADNRTRFPAHLQSLTDYQLQGLVLSAVENARKRVRRNYKTAIPQYYGGTLQLLLPLSLSDPLQADLAMVVERYNDFYRAATCLTLEMAFNNARQLARPDRDWLNP